MHFSYDVELPLGSWDCCKTGPMEPRAELLSPEALLVAMPQHTLSHSPCSLAIPWRLPALCRSAIWSSICIRCLSAVCLLGDKIRIHREGVQLFSPRCKAAPREILVRYRLLGSMRKILKMKTHEQVMEAVGLQILGGSK